MTTDYTLLGLLVATSFSALSSAWSTITAQTGSTGTGSFGSSFTASSGALGPLPELLLLIASCLGVVGMAIQGNWWTKAKKRTSQFWGRAGKPKRRFLSWPDRQQTTKKPTPQPIPEPDKPPTPIDDDDTEIPPPDKQLPLPPPVGDDAPRLPAGALAALASGNPSLSAIEAWAKKYLRGPVDARAALPWDAYEYPKTQPVPEADLAAFDRDSWLLDKFKSWFDSKGKDKPTDDEERNIPPDKQLPAMATQTAGGNWLKKFIGPTPLERYDAYLKANGIRHFSAAELTKHNWHKSKIKQGREWVPSNVAAKPVLQASAWQNYLEVIPPHSRIHFVMPRHVVPDPRLWPNIIPALRILDRFREWLGQPVRGVSAFRLPWYNTSIQGSPSSFHKTNSAVDFAYSKFTAEREMDVSIFYRFFTALYKLKGSGVGGYPQFCHMDYDQGRHNIRGKFIRWLHRARRNKNNVFFPGEKYNLVGKK